jgi:putative transcriptional regulator
MVVHEQPLLADVRITDGLFVAADKRTVEPLVTSEHGPVLFFIGHAGWGPGQLAMEMAEGAWLNLPATTGQVFADPESLWPSALKEVGRNKIKTLLKGQEIPEDPTVN